MKFDKFVKYAGGNGLIEEAHNGDKWLFYNGIGMKIPEGKNAYGNETMMPGGIDDLIYEYDDYDVCELKTAFVPNADSKPSELLRRFASKPKNGSEPLMIDIPNKVFGFIEKSDRTFINECGIGEDDYTVLLVTDDYGEVEEFKMIYIVKE